MRCEFRTELFHINAGADADADDDSYDDSYDDSAAAAATSASATTSMDPRAAMAFLSTAKIPGHLLEESVTVVMGGLLPSDGIVAVVFGAATANPGQSNA